MRCSHAFGIPFAAFAIAITSAATAAPITADATLELTFTLTDVTITDTLTGATSSATFETSTEAGDLRFEDIGPNGGTFTGEDPANPPGSVGAATASESILLNGLDPFVDDYDQDSFGIGDSLVTTMSAFATAETPGSVFFGQVNSDNTLYFSVFGVETDRYTFHFDYSAVLTGSLDSTALPGVTLVLADGNEVSGAADTTLAGPPNEFVVAMDYFSLDTFNGSGILLPLDEMDSGSFEVAFDAGDDNLRITFLSQLLVNARPEAIPEPASLGMLLLAMFFPLAARRRV
jgi:hypothetical protein